MSIKSLLTEDAMKEFCLSLFTMVAFGVAHADQPSFVGEYKQPRDVVMLNYSSKAACQKDKGRWSGGQCVFSSFNDLTVKKDGDQYQISVVTVTTNAHTCEY